MQFYKIKYLILIFNATQKQLSYNNNNNNKVNGNKKEIFLFNKKNNNTKLFNYIV